MTFWELAALGVVSLAAGSVLITTLRLGIGPVPTSARVRRAVLELIPLELEGELHELGAGWGGLAFALARRCPKARVIAWEASWVPYLYIGARQRLFGLPNLEVRRRNFFTGDLSQARGVVCYLFTGAMDRLGQKLHAELKPGALIVSHTFALRGWEAERTLHADDLYRTPVYRYVMPDPS